MSRSYGKFAIESPELFFGSFPVQTEPPNDIDSAENQRRVHCRRYGNCLTFAAAQNWRGFCCNSCDVDETISRDEWLRDLDGLTQFLYALHRKPSDR